MTSLANWPTQDEIPSQITAGLESWRVKKVCNTSVDKADNSTHKERTVSSWSTKFLFQTKRSVQICGASCLTNRILIKAQIWLSFVSPSLAVGCWTNLSVFSNLINPRRAARIFSKKAQNLITWVLHLFLSRFFLLEPFFKKIQKYLSWCQNCGETDGRRKGEGELPLSYREPSAFCPKISSLSEPRPPIFTLAHLCFTLESVKFLPPRLFTSFRHGWQFRDTVADLVLGWVLHMTSRDPI